MSVIIKITADRDSYCMADDMQCHMEEFEVNEKISIATFIDKLLETYDCKDWGIWIGNYDKFLCIKKARDNNWLIDEKTLIKNIFNQYDNYICFDRNGKCEN